MAITPLGGTSGGAIDGGDVTLDLTAITGLAENDLVIVAYAIGLTGASDFDMAMVTTGYTEVADLFADATRDCNLGAFWKLMGATPDTSAVVDGQGGANAAVGAVAMAFRVVDTTTPMDVTPTTATGTGSSAANPPSIDWTTEGVWTVVVGAYAHLGGAGETVAPPANYDTTNFQQNTTDDAADVTIGIAYRTDPSDPEDPGIFTADTTSPQYAWCAVTIALRPGAGGEAPAEESPWSNSLMMVGVGR